MKVFITMTNSGDVQTHALDLKTNNVCQFEILGQPIEFNLSKQGKMLVVKSSQPLCLLNDEKINLLEDKNYFEMPFGRGFSLIYPALDIYIKFDFNY